MNDKYTISIADKKLDDDTKQIMAELDSDELEIDNSVTLQEACNALKDKYVHILPKKPNLELREVMTNWLNR